MKYVNKTTLASFYLIQVLELSPKPGIYWYMIQHLGNKEAKTNFFQEQIMFNIL